VDIRYTYDINGLLEVEVTVLSTQKTERLVIEGHPGVLTKEEIDTRFEALAELKIHPQDKAENRALMARAQRLYEEHLGEVREAVGQYIDEFIRLLERQEPDGLDDFRARLAAVLDQIESDPYLA
jgi:molecular chaperone HscC